MSDTGPHIVVDARMASDGGIGTYLQQLLPRIARGRPDWRITALGDCAMLNRLGWDQLPNVRLQQVTSRIFSISEQVTVASRIPHDADLYWAPHYNLALLSRCPLVVTIHDVNHVALPELMGNPLRRWYAQWLIGAAVRRARRVLFDSDFTQREAGRFLDVNGKGTVVHLAVDDRWNHAGDLNSRRPIAEPYIVYVGNMKRHKNVPFLLRAFRTVMDRMPHRLLLIGRSEGLRVDSDIAAELEALGNRTTLLGEVSADDLLQFVRHADALVTASLYEGFGLPPLEAMAAGCPCVVSTAGSLPEVCGDAALYADPRDERAFGQRLLDVVSDVPLRESLVARGRARARQFDWDRSAALTARVLEDAFA